jgi:hypothetical protein
VDGYITVFVIRDLHPSTCQPLVYGARWPRDAPEAELHLPWTYSSFGWMLTGELCTGCK